MHIRTNQEIHLYSRIWFTLKSVSNFYKYTETKLQKTGKNIQIYLEDLQ
jgi:hypothetical protein